MGSISRHKITKWIFGFIWEPKTALGHSWLLRVSHANARQHGEIFPGCAYSLKVAIHCQRSVQYTHALLHHYQPLIQFYSTLAIESWCYHHVVYRPDLHSSDWLELFWPISNMHLFRDLLCLSGFCRVCPENFPAKRLKIHPIIPGYP